MRTAIVAWSCLLAAAACGPTSTDGPGGGGGDDDDGTGPDAKPDLGFIDASHGGGSEFIDAAPQAACSQMDILFVVDNSGSMAQEQTNLAANFPMFINVLDTFTTTDGTPIDYRVAVTSTGRDMDWVMELLPGFPPIPSSQSGDDGEMLMRCGMTKRWLDKGDPDVAGTFACAAQLGTGGPAQEMPLYATKLALGDRIADGTNAGFLRHDALLAIVILTDEDDCSREDNGFTLGFSEDVCDALAPVPGYATFLDTVTGGPGRWAVAAIAGPGPGSCSSDFGDAAEAARVRQFVDLAGDNGVFGNICEGDLASALHDALTTFDLACQNIPPVD